MGVHAELLWDEALPAFRGVEGLGGRLVPESRSRKHPNQTWSPKSILSKAHQMQICLVPFALRQRHPPPPHKRTPPTGGRRLDMQANASLNSQPAQELNHTDMSPMNLNP